MVSVIITHSLAVQLLLVNAFSETKHTMPGEGAELTRPPMPHCTSKAHPTANSAP